MKRIAVGLLFAGVGVLFMCCMVFMGAMGMLGAGLINPALAPFGAIFGAVTPPLFLMGVWASRD